VGLVFEAVYFYRVQLSKKRFSSTPDEGDRSGFRNGMFETAEIDGQCGKILCIHGDAVLNTRSLYILAVEPFVESLFACVMERSIN
jgi:hypothetical protein